MSSPAVVALKCTTSLPAIHRGEILYYNQLTKVVDRTGAGDGVPIVTAEAVTIYKGQKELSIPVVVLGKSEVLLRRKDDTGTLVQEYTGAAAVAGAKLYHRVGAGKNVITDSGNKDQFLGIAVHSITPKTASVDVILNFAH